MIAIILRFSICAVSALGAAHLSAFAVNALEERRATARAMSLEDVAGDPTLCLVLLAAFSAMLATATDISALPPLLALSWLLSRKAAPLLAKRRAAELRSKCEGQLDACADIVAMGVRAGLSFDAALDMYCSKFSGELSRELGNARAQWQSGVASRERALLDLSERIGSKRLKRFSETVTQSIHYGSPMAEMLQTFADDLRRQRRVDIEQLVAKAPIKMLVPTGVCILPAMLLLILGPVLLQVLSSDL